MIFTPLIYEGWMQNSANFAALWLEVTQSQIIKH